MVAEPAWKPLVNLGAPAFELSEAPGTAGGGDPAVVERKAEAAGFAGQLDHQHAAGILRSDGGKDLYIGHPIR